MRRVELHTAQRVKSGHENDYCVRDGLKCRFTIQGSGYSRLVGRARYLSKKLGEVYADGHYYFGCDVLEQGLAAVYILSTESVKSVLRSETYDFFEDGHYARTVKYEYSEGGKVSRTEYTNE